MCGFLSCSSDDVTSCISVGRAMAVWLTVLGIRYGMPARYQYHPISVRFCKLIHICSATILVYSMWPITVLLTGIQKETEQYSPLNHYSINVKHWELQSITILAKLEWILTTVTAKQFAKRAFQWYITITFGKNVSWTSSVLTGSY